MYAQGQPAYSYLSGFGIPINQPVTTPVIQAQAAQLPTRASAGFGNKGTISNDTSSKDPELLKARIFVGNVNSTQCTRNDLVDLCQPYGNLKALSLLKGYAFVQYETQSEAEMAIKILNGYNFFGQKLDVRLAAIGRGSNISANSTTGPVRRPKHDFLFGGQRIRVETTNIRNRTFSQDIFGALKDINFHEHGQNDTIICGSCRSVFTAIKPYVEHRRQKKCQFFERDVAPSVVSCFTCKEQFNEPWQFIQHLIHRHSINLYRDQPESDPATYIAKTKAQQSAEGKKDDAPVVETQNGNQPTVEPQNGNNNELEKSAETGSTPQQPVIINEPEKDPATIEQPAVVTIAEEQVTTPKSPTSVKAEPMDDDEPQVIETTSSSAMDIPSYSSAISIGVSANNPATYVSASSAYLPTIPSFNSQIPPPFQQPTYPTYQFTQPLVTASSMQHGYPTSHYGTVSMAPSSHGPQISLPQFMAQSSAAAPKQGGLSEEEQMRLLEELDNI